MIFQFANCERLVVLACWEVVFLLCCEELYIYHYINTAIMEQNSNDMLMIIVSDC
jgi:hypothetical protein